MAGCKINDFDLKLYHRIFASNRKISGYFILGQNLNPLMLKKVTLFLFTLIISYGYLFAQPTEAQKHWADSVYQHMSPKERIGQLFMVAAYSNQGKPEQQMVERLIKQYHVGGLIFFQGGPVRQTNLLNHYQSVSKTPLWVGMDAEWGVSMRLDSVPAFPRQMTLGAMPQSELVHEMGAVVADQFKALGMQIDFAPVADVNVNPKNPVIGTRSFGENTHNVESKTIAYMRGLQSNGIIANAKHFPGHGDTGKDSHYALPVIPYGRTRLDEVELKPFRGLIQAGVESIMVGHLELPKIDGRKNRPASLSDKIIKGILRDDLHFDGLVFTDALNMHAVSDNFSPGQAEVLALQAGNDVLLFPANVAKGVTAIEKALADGTLDSVEVAHKVKKILLAKAKAGLNDWQPLPTDGLVERLNTPKVKALRYKMYEQAATLVTNKDNYLPIQVLDTTKFAYLGLNSNTGHNTYYKYLNRYIEFDGYHLGKKATSAQIRSMEAKLKTYGTIVVGIHHMSRKASQRYGINREEQMMIERLQLAGHRVVVTVFGNPYAVQFMGDAEHLICAYDDVEEAHQAAAALIFGAIPAKGKLPVSAGPKFPAGTGLGTQNLRRLRCGNPESEGMDSQILNKIDSVAAETIKQKAAPGMQILVVRNGSIVFDRDYGYQTYAKKVKVQEDVVYDLASVTKVAATTQVLMYLYQQNLIDLDKKASYYLPELKGSNKEDLIIRDIISHQAGLFPYYPFWDSTMVAKRIDPKYYSVKKIKDYDVPVAKGVFGRHSLPDSLWHWAINSPLREKPADRLNKPYDYRYSDIGMYIMYQLASKLLSEPMEEFVMNNFYEPLGASTLCFNPKRKLPLSRIIPSEKDDFFRHEELRGDVNDPHAAMHGGAWGHAGLFGDAIDLAKLMQMNLQGGSFGGVRYFMPAVIDTFTAQQYTLNRRGLGWDKPHLEDPMMSSASRYASRDSYGHSGFTGTLVWVDPQYDLVYIFLSNRTYPTSRNKKLVTLNIRPTIQDFIYKSITDQQITDLYDNKL